ncbi:MAG: hypothetical protein KFH87_12850 [Bacteroidetes bacterium]|nr:hypothetical protein [Bacteroidota bacterium]
MECVVLEAWRTGALSWQRLSAGSPASLCRQHVRLPDSAAPAEWKCRSVLALPGRSRPVDERHGIITGYQFPGFPADDPAAGEIDNHVEKGKQPGA